MKSFTRSGGIESLRCRKLMNDDADDVVIVDALEVPASKPADAGSRMGVTGPPVVVSKNGLILTNEKIKPFGIDRKNEREALTSTSTSTLTSTALFRPRRQVRRRKRERLTVWGIMGNGKRGMGNGEWYETRNKRSDGGRR